MHASAVALAGRGLLITGRSGAGKTTLALGMVALGAALVADDRVCLAADDAGGVRMSAPTGLAGLAEVRGFGLIRLPAARSATLALVADLDQPVVERMPERRSRQFCGVAVPVFAARDRPGLAALLVCILRADEWLPPHYLASR